MKARIVWAPTVREVAAELLAAIQEEIFSKIDLLERFPRMYTVCGKGWFRRHRRFLVGGWLVYYRVVGNTVYIRGLWPARIP